MKRIYCNYGYLPRYCQAWLEGLASVLPDPARYLEIGTGSGCSLIAALFGLAHHDDVHAWTVDITPRPYLQHEMDMREIDEERYTSIVTPGGSLEVAKTWNTPLDMVYIDGDHSYEGCQSDIRAWEPHLRFGGLMVFDDYEQGMWHVTAAVDDIMFADDSTWRFVGQVGRLIAFEKGTRTARAPWLTDDMVKYDSYAISRLTGERDAWRWYGWGFPDKPSGELYERNYGKSPKPANIGSVP